MARNPFDISIKPIKIQPIYTLGNSPKSGTARTLGKRDKEILYKNARGRCENCGKKIDPFNMEAGHKIAASKGGKATIGNSVCLCHDCNRRQGTDSWTTFQKKQKKTNFTTVTSREKKPRKSKKKSAKTNFSINPFTGRKERAPSLFRF